MSLCSCLLFVQAVGDQEVSSFCVSLTCSNITFNSVSSVCPHFLSFFKRDFSLGQDASSHHAARSSIKHFKIAQLFEIMDW